MAASSDQFSLADGQIDLAQGAHRAEADTQPGHAQERRWCVEDGVPCNGVHQRQSGRAEVRVMDVES